MGSQLWGQYRFGLNDRIPDDLGKILKKFWIDLRFSKSVNTREISPKMQFGAQKSSNAWRYGGKSGADFSTPFN